MEQFLGDVSCNFIYNREKEEFIARHNKRSDNDSSYPFGWFWIKNRQTGEEEMKDFCLGYENGLHDDIENDLLDDWASQNNVSPMIAEKSVEVGYRLRGRVWCNSKAFAFDQNKNGVPSPQELRKIIKDLGEALGMDFSDYKFYVNDGEDPRSKTKDWHYVNEYDIQEYITGVNPNEKKFDFTQKKRKSESDSIERIGMQKYHDALTNDPRLDNMYKHFVAEAKKRKIVINEHQKNRLLKMMLINECVDNIIEENIF